MMMILDRISMWMILEIFRDGWSLVGIVYG